MLDSGWLQVLRLLEPFGAVKDLQLFMGKARAKGTPTVRGCEGRCEVLVKERGCERGVRDEAAGAALRPLGASGCYRLLGLLVLWGAVTRDIIIS